MVLILWASQSPRWASVFRMPGLQAQRWEVLRRRESLSSGNVTEGYCIHGNPDEPLHAFARYPEINRCRAFVFCHHPAWDAPSGPCVSVFTGRRGDNLNYPPELRISHPGFIKDESAVLLQFAFDLNTQRNDVFRMTGRSSCQERAHIAARQRYHHPPHSPKDAGAGS